MINTTSRMLKGCNGNNSYAGMIEPGKVHHVVCQVEGNKVSHIVDGKVLFEFTDGKPLKGEGHETVMLYTWGAPAKATFDNLKVYTKD